MSLPSLLLSRVPFPLSRHNSVFMAGRAGQKGSGAAKGFAEESRAQQINGQEAVTG